MCRLPEAGRDLQASIIVSSWVIFEEGIDYAKVICLMPLLYIPPTKNNTRLHCGVGQDDVTVHFRTGFGNSYTGTKEYDK